jgi:hypothetical protein
VPSPGTSLWNIQTQSPEWVQLPQVKSKLASGVYRTYAGSDVTTQAGIGSEGAQAPEAAAVSIAGGATPTNTQEFREAATRVQEFSRQYDNAGDKALAFVDGTVSGLAGGLLEGLPAGS